MKKRLIAAAATLSLLCIGSTPGLADDNAEMYLERAQEVLHHSCASLVEEANEDATQIDMVAKLMVAVSLYNRDIDITEFAQSDDEVEGLKTKFVDTVKKECEEDSDSLLAGVVDRAVVHALTTD